MLSAYPPGRLGRRCGADDRTSDLVATVRQRRAGGRRPQRRQPSRPTTRPARSRTSHIGAGPTRQLVREPVDSTHRNGSAQIEHGPSANLRTRRPEFGVGASWPGCRARIDGADTAVVCLRRLGGRAGSGSSGPTRWPASRPARRMKAAARVFQILFLDTDPIRLSPRPTGRPGDQYDDQYTDSRQPSRPRRDCPENGGAPRRPPCGRRCFPPAHRVRGRAGRRTRAARARPPTTQPRTLLRHARRWYDIDRRPQRIQQTSTRSRCQIEAAPGACLEVISRAFSLPVRLNRQRLALALRAASFGEHLA